MENRKVLNRIKNRVERIENKINRLVPFMGIVILAIISRLLPHPPNIAPIAGLALLSGANLKNKWSFAIPLTAMVLSDIFLGFHPTIPFVYGSFFIITVIGMFLKNKQTFAKIVCVSLIASFLFFFITNFGVWLTSSMYTKNLTGLINSYIMGLPFLRNTIMGDLIYTLGLFYGYRFLSIVCNSFVSVVRHQ